MMRVKVGTVTMPTLSLTESIRVRVSTAVGLRIEPFTRAKIEKALWDVGTIQGEFIYIIEDEVTEYIDHYA